MCKLERHTCCCLWHWCWNIRFVPTPNFGRVHVECSTSSISRKPIICTQTERIRSEWMSTSAVAVAPILTQQLFLSYVPSTFVHSTLNEQQQQKPMGVAEIPFTNLRNVFTSEPPTNTTNFNLNKSEQQKQSSTNQRTNKQTNRPTTNATIHRTINNNTADDKKPETKTSSKSSAAENASINKNGSSSSGSSKSSSGSDAAADRKESGAGKADKTKERFVFLASAKLVRIRRSSHRQETRNQKQNESSIPTTMLF